MSDHVSVWRHRNFNSTKPSVLACHQNFKGALSRYSVISLQHFVVGKNNGGCAFFQLKRTQKVYCLPFIVVSFVLCSEVYTSAPEKSRGLPSDDPRTKTSIAQDRSMEHCRLVVDFMHFLPLFMSTITGQPLQGSKNLFSKYSPRWK